jgi:hypothetical protein
MEMDLLSDHVSGLAIQKLPSGKWNTVLKWTNHDQNIIHRCTALNEDTESPGSITKKT